MKRIIFLTIWVVFLAWSASAQQGVRTETASNKYKYHSSATTGDTLFTSASGEGFIVGLRIGIPVASDTIILLSGVDTVLQLVQPSSAPFVYNVDIQAHIDSCLVFIQKKTSGSILIYRTRY